MDLTRIYSIVLGGVFTLLVFYHMIVILFNSVHRLQLTSFCDTWCIHLYFAVIVL